MFKLKRDVEVVFDGALVAPGDDDDRLYARGDCFPDVLNQGLVTSGNISLGTLWWRAESAYQTCRGKTALRFSVALWISDW